MLSFFFVLGSSILKLIHSQHSGKIPNKVCCLAGVLKARSFLQQSKPIILGRIRPKKIINDKVSLNFFSQLIENFFAISSHQTKCKLTKPCLQFFKDVLKAGLHLGTTAIAHFQGHDLGTLPELCARK